MRNFIFITSLFLVVATGSAQAQNEVDKKLAEAESSYSGGDLEGARFALQQSLAELDKLVGEEILKALPAEMGGVPASVENDEMSGSALGFAGVYVSRGYYREGVEKAVNLEIITNSPFLAMVNASLTNPLIASMSGGKQKIVKIGGYKSLVEETEGQYGQQYDIKIPVNDAMISLECAGYSQSEAIALANTLPLKQIIPLMGGTQ